MAIIFHVISTQLNAYRALGGGTYIPTYDAAAGAIAPVIITDGTSGVFGGELIQLSDASHLRGIQYPGSNNMPTSAGPITVRVRIMPRFTGAPSANMILWSAEGFGDFNTNTCWLYLDTTNKLNFLIKDSYGKTYVNVASVAISPTLTSGTPVEFMASWDGTTTAGKVVISMNGVQVSALTATNPAVAWDNRLINYIGAGFSARFQITNYDLNEMVIYNTAENAVYTPNTTFVTDTAFDASTYTDPGIANVRSTTSYVVAGVTETGTAVIPSAFDVRFGTAVDNTTGTAYIPLANQVLNGVNVDHTVGNLVVTPPTQAMHHVLQLNSSNQLVGPLWVDQAGSIVTSGLGTAKYTILNPDGTSTGITESSISAAGSGLYEITPVSVSSLIGPIQYLVKLEITVGSVLLVDYAPLVIDNTLSKVNTTVNFIQALTS